MKVTLDKLYILRHQIFWNFVAEIAQKYLFAECYTPYLLWDGFGKKRDEVKGDGKASMRSYNKNTKYKSMLKGHKMSHHSHVELICPAYYCTSDEGYVLISVFQVVGLNGVKICCNEAYIYKDRWLVKKI